MIMVMLLAALVIGLVTAYAYGLRAGVWAAGSALALFLVAAIVPVTALPIYAVTAIAVAVTSSAAARRGPHAQAKRAIDLGRAAWRRWRGRAR